MVSWKTKRSSFGNDAEESHSMQHRGSLVLSHQAGSPENRQPYSNLFPRRFELQRQYTLLEFLPSSTFNPCQILDGGSGDPPWMHTESFLMSDRKPILISKTQPMLKEASCAVFFRPTTSAWQDPQDHRHHPLQECVDTWLLWGAESSG